MIYAIGYIIFILLFTSWLGRELKSKYSLKEHWPWILGAVFVGLLGSMLSNVYNDKFGNFLLHASGGVSSVLLFVYLCKTLKLNFSWMLTSMFLFAFISTLGVLNELAEYILELLGLSVFSFDTHDTWRDFVANTTGATIIWLMYCTVRQLSVGKIKQSKWF